MNVRATCIVSHFNYAKFVVDACESALSQVHPFDEILLVDDGSTDGSTDVVTKHYASHDRIQLVCKPNGGQLSCFAEGFARATGDVVFFLDADDIYEPEYVSQVLAHYASHPECDFVMVAHRKFGAVDRLELDGYGDRDLGYSILAALYARRWIGAPTSCLSMRRHVLETIFPLDFAEDWRTRADDCLVFGASVAGARKWRLDRPLVRYRIHDTNWYQGQKQNPVSDYRRKIAVNRLLQTLSLRIGYDRHGLAEFAHREFRTIPRPTARQLGDYSRIGLLSRTLPLRKLGIVASVFGHYVRSRWLPGRDG
jgi:glycosyltransferase involved in cell wall biosynthesis